MSNKELDRVTVMARLTEGSLSQRAAAAALGITERQVGPPAPQLRFVAVSAAAPHPALSRDAEPL